MSTLGALPQTPASLVAPQGQAVKTQPPDPVAKCWVGSKASRVKCTASPPLTPLHLRESSKTIRSGRSWKPVKACEATACGLAFTGWRRPNASQVRVQEVFPAPLPRGERGCGQRPRCWQDPLGSRSRGQCAVGTHFKGFGVLVYKAQSQLCVALLGCLVIGGRMSPVSLKLPHAPCAPYHLITFKCSCRASLWPLAEPFQPKLGLSLYERLMPIFTPSRIIPN